MKKVAFIHYAKAGGVSVNHHIYQRVLKNKTYQNYNSWRENGFYDKPLRRDWNEKELLEICKKNGNEDFIIAHNHHNGWNKKIILKFKKEGWFTFCFLRNPKDILCSLYFFSKQSKERTGYSAVGPLGAIAGHLPPESFEVIDEQDISLDEFIHKMVENPKLHRFWKLPSYINYLDFVGRINNENIKICFQKAFNYDYKHNPYNLQRFNATKNKGYEYYFKNGIISKKTNVLLRSHPEFKNYKKYLWKKV
jgi:hypothetical protein